jgi:hypothetical protein
VRRFMASIMFMRIFPFYAITNNIFTIIKDSEFFIMVNFSIE